MNKLENFSKPLIWSAALLLTAVAAGCGGGGGGAPATGGTMGSPAAVNLLSASTYALTTSAGLSASIGTASGVTGVSNSATFGGDVAMDAPTAACTSNPAAATAGADGNTCGMANDTTPAFNIPNGLAVTGTTIRYAATNSSAINTSVRAVKNDVNTAWKDAISRAGGAAISGPGTLDGLTLVPGIYTSASTMTLGSGQTLTLDAGGNTNAVWIFQVGSNLTITGSTVACTGTTPNQICTPTQVKLINGALARNVFWQVGAPGAAGSGNVSFPAATGPVQNNTLFNGTIMAGGDVTFGGGTAVVGRVLAGADLLGTPNTQTGGAVSATGGSTGAISVTLPQ